MLINDHKWEIRSKKLSDLLQARFVSQNIEVPLSDYKGLVENSEIYRPSEGPKFTVYQLVLKHPSDAEKDVIVYRAYHRENLELIKTHYLKLFNINTV
ncbi:MAG: hypothetical protein ACKOA8_17360 [Deltaproteobacteria bacterium]